MVMYGSNDYDVFLGRADSTSTLEELLTEVEGGDACEVAFERPIPSGPINDRYEVIQPKSSTTIIYDRIDKERVFVSEKSRRVFAGKIKERIRLIKLEGSEEYKEINDDCAQFLRNSWDAEYLHDLEQAVSGEQFDGTRWEGTIPVGKVNGAYEIVESDGQYIVIDHHNEDERFNISEHGVERFLSTLSHILEQEYCHGLDYDTYCALQDE